MASLWNSGDEMPEELQGLCLGAGDVTVSSLGLLGIWADCVGEGRA